MEDYTFEKFWEDLDNGFEIYCDYIGKRYLIYKTAKNSYTQRLIETETKSPHPKFNIITLKRLQEIFPNLQELEYKI